MDGKNSYEANVVKNNLKDKVRAKLGLGPGAKFNLANLKIGPPGPPGIAPIQTPF